MQSSAFHMIPYCLTPNNNPELHLLAVEFLEPVEDNLFVSVRQQRPRHLPLLHALARRICTTTSSANTTVAILAQLHLVVFNRQHHSKRVRETGGRQRVQQIGLGKWPRRNIQEISERFRRAAFVWPAASRVYGET